MGRIRHWKERFDPSADLIFSKRMRLHMCGVETVNYGDPVTDEMKDELGKHRMLVWWNANVIQLAPADAPARVEPTTEPAVEKLGGGWYNVTPADGDTVKVHGKKALAALLDG